MSLLESILPATSQLTLLGEMVTLHGIRASILQDLKFKSCCLHLVLPLHCRNLYSIMIAH